MTYYITKLFHSIIIIIICGLNPLLKCDSIASISENYRVDVNPLEQPPTHVYERDRKYLEQSFINCVETYRMALCNDSLKNVYMPLGSYQFYAIRWLDNDNFDYVGSPIPTSQQIKVFTDTILYNKSKNICFALMIVKRQFSYIKGLQRESVRFDGMALIGYRDNINNPFKIYPQETSCITGEWSYKSCQETIRFLYFERFKYGGAPFSEVISGQQFPDNVGDSLFFDRSPYFKKYDKTRYYFQMKKRHNGVFEFTFTGDSIMIDYDWEKYYPYFK